MLIKNWTNIPCTWQNVVDFLPSNFATHNRCQSCDKPITIVIFQPKLAATNNVERRLWKEGKKKSGHIMFLSTTVRTWKNTIKSSIIYQWNRRENIFSNLGNWRNCGTINLDNNSGIKSTTPNNERKPPNCWSVISSLNVGSVALQ